MPFYFYWWQIHPLAGLENVLQNLFSLSSQFVNRFPQLSLLYNSPRFKISPYLVHLSVEFSGFLLIIVILKTIFLSSPFYSINALLFPSQVSVCFYYCSYSSLLNYSIDLIIPILALLVTRCAQNIYCCYHYSLFQLVYIFLLASLCLLCILFHL